MGGRGKGKSNKGGQNLHNDKESDSHSDEDDPTQKKEPTIVRILQLLHPSSALLFLLARCPPLPCFYQLWPLSASALIANFATNQFK